VGDVLGVLAAIAVFVIIVTALVRDERPRRGSYLMPPVDLPPDFEPPVITAPAPMFHSRYCAGRYGSPCNCKGPHT